MEDPLAAVTEEGDHQPAIEIGRLGGAKQLALGWPAYHRRAAMPPPRPGYAYCTACPDAGQPNLTRGQCATTPHPALASPFPVHSQSIPNGVPGGTRGGVRACLEQMSAVSPVELRDPLFFVFPISSRKLDGRWAGNRASMARLGQDGEMTKG
ncbi:hypothetical protein AOQ84DRAFT_226179 [Glonium stellatum]|uniref:Uncharacterized protein n=1 Tax=Glonium stellatum TaxID=574774 RepID=A0A8E2JP65_9PEZI|nr:hypothetical protein AOQ84DRAFT_226179 [Glonium stellatum]